MFNRKKYFPSRLLFSKASIEEIVKQLQDAGFQDITFKIPNEYKKFDKFEFSAREFIDLSYNFVSQILIAKNGAETIKILFINNSSSQAVFNDTTFPSSNSEHTKFSITTNDPVRIIGLIDFLENLLESNSLRKSFSANFQERLLFVTYFFLLIMFMSLTNIFNNEKSYTITFFSDHTLLLSFLTLLSLLYIFYYSLTPGGLYINKFEHPFISFSKRIFVGDLKDNLIISSLVSITKIVIAGFLLNIVWYFFEDITINSIKFVYSVFISNDTID